MRAIEIDNPWLRACILPDVGAKILDLIWKPADRNLLWRNARIAPITYPVEGVFDNYWCGGWDDCFPTCDACAHAGEQYPNLGELRSISWTVDSLDAGAATLSAFGPISPVHVVKSVKLDPGAPILRVHQSITNIGPKPLDFLWGTHPALNVSAGAILHIPARTAIVGESSCAAFGSPGQSYDWPLLRTAAAEMDMSRVLPPQSAEFCGHYAVDLQAGWYAVEDSVTGSGFLLKFPLESCPVLWLWLNYGGYRGHYHVVIEPWTGHPVSLAEAVRQGKNRRLEAGAVFEVGIVATAFDRPDTWRTALARVQDEVSS
ncbi:MAG: hypothetical protein LC130_33735 [Bryobacterales bacterium]|nr:hypothetical protein [Bryobacterales bacterium]MEB2363221.1 hypothetical protein [Bryobacterales bacterium]